MQEQHNSEGHAWEKRTLQIFLFVSALLHLLAFFLKAPSWTKKTEPPEQEWEIVADLGGLDLGSMGELEKEVQGLSEREKEKMLPQLPKAFQEFKPKELVEEASKELPDLPNESKQDNPDAKRIVEDKPAEEKAKVEEVSKKKEEDEATKIFKKDLIARLKKEQLRLEKKKKEKKRTKQKKISSLLEARKNELKGVQKGSSNNGEISKTHPYIYKIRERISRVYTLPGVYRIESTQIPILRILIAKSGAIDQLEILESSNNLDMDQLALKTVQDAAPFPEPPEEFWGQALQLRFDPKLM